MTEHVHAEPTKKFFLEMLTRDISLEDSILDLVDNCIDALVRTRDIDLDEKLLDQRAVDRITRPLRDEGLPTVEIDFSEEQFRITDHCGGIDYESAKTEVFRFGKVSGDTNSRLSVYGIGLKRAIFKLGQEITVDSKTIESGFRVDIHAESWAKDDQNWVFPIAQSSKARTEHSAGTTITVKKLNSDVKARLNDGIFSATLNEAISAAYALFLDRFLTVKVNGTRIKPKAIPLGMSKDVVPARDSVEIGNVNLTMLAGLAERIDDEWNADRAGWYVFCNGRVVVFADKTDLTGWGVSGPQFVSKYRGFIGLAFFFSDSPQDLPWTTTKRGLNRESRAYATARNRMASISKGVLNFLSRMYATGEPEEIEEREIAQTVRATTLSRVLTAAKPTFQVTARTSSPSQSEVSVQFKVKRAELENIKRYIKRPGWSAGRIGLHVWDYFIQRELGK